MSISSWQCRLNGLQKTDVPANVMLANASSPQGPQLSTDDTGAGLQP
jgi:hypothetical protein